MSENLAIIVLLGSRRAGQEFTATLTQAAENARSGNPAHRVHPAPPIQRQIQLIASYAHRLRFLSPRRQVSLLDIERDVNEQINNLHASSFNVAAILFLCDDRYPDFTAYPFKLDTSFLGLSGPALFKKLTVVPPIPGDDWGKPFQGLVDEGMCILSFESRSDDLLPRILARISQGMDVVRGQIDEIYRRAAVQNRRNEGQAVILLVGETLHGKSKTINRLIGQELLPVSTTAHGSTTKIIERVKVHNTSTETATTVAVAFDDTPGFQSTTEEDRELNKTLMTTYKQEYFEGTYPNVILLVATWDLIIPNAEHQFPHITSAVGRSMQSLRDSGLVDNKRANVVVVVTKSLSSHLFTDLKSRKDKTKNNAWLTEAEKCRTLIAKLQRKILPKSPEWETVFIENGGGKDMKAKYPKLPDRNLSHDNLYRAICKIVESPEPYGIGDLAGIQALQVLSGAEPLGPNFRADRQFLLAPSHTGGFIEKAVMRINPQSPDQRTGKLIASYFGVTYDVTHGSFGRSSGLDLKDLHLQLTVPNNQQKEFEQLTTPLPTSERPDAERLRAHYSSDWGFKSALQPQSRCYILHHVIRVVSVDTGTLKLGAHIQEEVENLPPWSPKSAEQYMDFFARHGTHILAKLALGGMLRVIVHSTDGRRRDNVMIFSDGAGAFASEIIALLEEKFGPQLKPSDWEQTYAKWIEGLEKDPVFCPDHELTEYRPIYNFPGLAELQKEHLQEAYKVYITRNVDRGVHQTKLHALPRQSNLTGAIRSLRESVTQAVIRVWQG
ncbi:hypothetical protein B0H19DRAFT_1259386 [Mycena capillaripes]|nr:hypothetical protein B0H19DRAFT_1259386 [Mycena capillaripes]